jgi:hypothetical protein
VRLAFGWDKTLPINPNYCLLLIVLRINIPARKNEDLNLRKFGSSEEIDKTKPGGERKLVVGEKLWEAKGKYGTPAIKAVGADGVCLEGTLAVQVKGVGRAKGIDGVFTYTNTILMGPSGMGSSHGQGIFTTMTGEMAVVKGSGIGKVEGGKGKAVGLMSFMTMSPKLNWLNNLIAVITQEGDPMWQEFELTIYEWK